jgi:hypothetical protein
MESVFKYSLENFIDYYDYDLVEEEQEMDDKHDIVLKESKTSDTAPTSNHYKRINSNYKTQ